MSLVPAVYLAQPQAAPFTVEEAVARAIQYNPNLWAAVGDVWAAQAGVSAARALTNPSSPFTPALTSGGLDEELLLQQPLELNGTHRARTGVAAAQLGITRAEAVVALRRLVFETKTAYYELDRVQELRRIAQELLQPADEIDRSTRRQVELGSRPGIDLAQTGIEVTRARQQVTVAKSRVATTLAALNTLMGRPPTEPVGTHTPAVVSVELPERESAVQQALAARAEIAAAEANRDSRVQEAGLAKAQGRPDLAPQFRAGRVIGGVEDAGIGIGVTLPLVDYGSRRQRVRQAEAAARAQDARIDAVRGQVRQEVDQARSRLRASEIIAKEYQQGVLEQARRVLESSRTGFQAGATSVIALLEAQRTYRSVLTEYANALAVYGQARAELERATGAIGVDRLPTVPSAGRRS